jgi:hypothetical protein
MRAAAAAQLLAEPETQTYRELFATRLSVPIKGEFQNGTGTGCTVQYCTCDVIDLGQVKIVSIRSVLVLVDRSSCRTDVDGHVFITCSPPPMTCAVSARAKGDYVPIYRTQYCTYICHGTTVPTHSTRTQAPGVPARQLRVEGTKASQTFDCIRSRTNKPSKKTSDSFLFFYLIFLFLL